jgi:hypothetical protein
MKSQNYEICVYLIISYVETGKKLSELRTFFTYNAYKHKPL